MTEDHWPLFAEFALAEKAVGGPDPQLALMAELARMHNCDIVESVWMAGCYGTVHCVPTAFVTWQNFRPQDVVVDNGPLYRWLEQNWVYLPVRPEMRSARMAEKRLQCLTNFAQYALDYQPGMHYEERWDHSLSKIKYYGRYMAIKVLEMWRMMVPEPQLVIPDIRARGGWSPRRTLARLWPEITVLGNEEDRSAAAAATMEMAAKETRDRLAREGVELSFFQLQVLLCIYREALNGGFYPGAGHDEEMEFMSIVARQFPLGPIYEARKNIFDEKVLGELNGWDSRQKPRLIEWKQKGEARFGVQHY